jgi:hypothetical protein
MKSNSNFKMSKPLKVMLTGMEGKRKKDFRDAMISAIIAPKIEFKKKKKEGLDEATNN